MRKTIIALAAVLAIAGCSTAEKDAALGGTAGAIIGGLATDSVGGAVVGGAAGALGGYLLGRATRRGYCEYRHPRTRKIYVDRCPAGY